MKRGGGVIHARCNGINEQGARYAVEMIGGFGCERCDITVRGRRVRRG